MTQKPDPLAHAARKYEFRPRGPFEGAQQYKAALIAHVADRDLAAAEELRLGRPQAEWTPAEVTAFREHLFAIHRGPREQLPPGTPIPMIDGGQHPVSEDSLLTLAARGVAAFVEKRQVDATQPLFIMANVLLTTGHVWIAPIVERGDRVAVIKTLAQEMPVFGFFVVFDAFLHRISAAGQPTQRAEKIDTILAHVGTRDLRRLITRPYRIVRGRAIFDDPPPADLDKRGPETKFDPYASIFVSVPPSAKPQ
jgi:hypothetical protein